MEKTTTIEVPNWLFDYPLRHPKKEKALKVNAVKASKFICGAAGTLSQRIIIGEVVILVFRTPEIGVT